MLPVTRFTQFIEQNNLFTAQNRILLAVSGGIDSVLMAHLFAATPYTFAIAHCNFALRGADADTDQQFCRQLAISLNVPFYTTRFNTTQYAKTNKLSVQMAARELRYTWFEHIRQQYGFYAVAVAHHQNDTIETILLNLTRGTGIAGLHGILPKNGHIVRPLMFLGRDEIGTLARQMQMPFVEDSSNASTKYARNKLRHEVVPILKALNPNLEHTFENNLRHFRQLEQMLQIQVEYWRSRILHTRDGEHIIAISDVKALQPQQLLLYKLLQPFGFAEPVVDDLLQALPGHAGKQFKAANYSLVIDREQIIIMPNVANTGKQIVEVQVQDAYVEFSGFRIGVMHEDVARIISDNPFSVSVDAHKLIYPLTIRTWQQGDKFYPLGMRTRQKLSDFFVHQKLPRHKKDQVPLIVNGNGDIVWVAGYRPDDRYKVTLNTKKVTIFELLKIA